MGLEFIHLIVPDAGHNTHAARVPSQDGDRVVIPFIRDRIAGLDGEQLRGVHTGFPADAVLLIQGHFLHQAFHFAPILQCPRPRDGAVIFPHGPADGIAVPQSKHTDDIRNTGGDGGNLIDRGIDISADAIEAAQIRGTDSDV